MARRPIAEAFYAGLYAEVLERTIDTASLDIPEESAAFVVGALAFVGRIEEARVVLGSMRREATKARSRTGRRKAVRSVEETADRSAERLRGLVASRFFLGVACARAGRHAEAEREFRENLREAGASLDPTSRFYVAQGLACFRYFRGKIALAARHVGRSLRHSIDARFQYGRLLATDLRGHALVQTGHVRAGIALLEQAGELARTLGLAGNVGAIECALATYRARFGVIPLSRAIEELEALLRTTAAEDSYSRGIVQAELAQQLALAGRGDEAWAKLDALAAGRAPDGHARADVRFLLACAEVARLRYGIESARTYVAEARVACAATDDDALEADVLAAEIMVAEEGARAAIAAQLLALHRATGISRAELYARMFDDGGKPASSVRVAEFEEDRAGARLIARGTGGLARLLRDGHLGLVPLVVGAPPEASIVEVSGDGFALAERGNVRLLDDATAGAARLLRELAVGEGAERAFRSKEHLLAHVWGIARYRPDRHDSIVHTAVSRLRGLLGASAHWIESRNGAYRLAPNVAYRALGSMRSDLGVEAPETAADVASPSLVAPSASAASAPTTVSPEVTIEVNPGEAKARERALLAHLAAAGSCSTAEVAAVLRVSEMTAFRTIRVLLDEGRLTRTGKGRGTRYTTIVHEDEGRKR